MGLIYCGIDEAGYGPMLGPLCVGFSAFRLETWDPQAGAPDLWKLLRQGVCRDGADKRRRIAIADSKKLKLSNQHKTKHPLTHLERGVLAFAGLLDRVPRLSEPCGDGTDSPDDRHGRHGRGTPGQGLDSDAGLFAALGVKLEPHGWYGGEPTPLPQGCTADQIAIARNKVALACDGAGVEPLALACIAVGEREFNEVVRTGGSKGHVTGQTFVRYLRRALERWGRGSDDLRIVCDRHGGRTSYRTMIEAAVRGPGYEIETLEESERCSRYAISACGADRPPARPPGSVQADSPRHNDPPAASPSIVLHFLPEAEDSHLPVALASMTAKLVRELAMARFNRYWCLRMPELKPTAGYTLDARRWLRDAEGILREEDREALVRMA